MNKLILISKWSVWLIIAFGVWLYLKGVYSFYFDILCSVEPPLNNECQLSSELNCWNGANWGPLKSSTPATDLLFFIVEAAHHHHHDDHKVPNNQSTFRTRIISSSRHTVDSGKPIKLLSHAHEKKDLFLCSFYIFHAMQMFTYLDDNILWVNKVDMNVTGITANIKIESNLGFGL